MTPPENNWQTIGHKNAKRMLDAQLSSDNLPHAYLFMGAKGIGKSILAEEFAKKIINGLSHNLSIFDISTTGSIDEIRELLHFAALTPISGIRKVVIIKNIDRISEISANALLKTLEEPANGTYFILLSNKMKILPTIMSRCQIMNLGRLSEKEMKEFAAKENLTGIGENIFSLAGGNPSRLILLSENTEESKAIVSHIDTIERAIGDGDFQMMNLVKNFALLEDEVLIEILSGWVYRQIGELTKKPQRFTAVKIALESIARLKHSFNKKMVLEYFVTNTLL